MKKFCILPLVAALAFFVSCQKQQSEEEKKAEVERQVQERLAVERQADEKQRLAQQQAELEAREKALAAKEAAAAAANVPAETTIEAPAEAPVEAPQPVRRTRDTSETRSTASYGTFYRKLEPYGDWRETSDYGYVWQPREAQERNWRPYTDGRWVYTDAGWTWVSEEPFGWATYHYGRWVRLRRVGWVWVPGEEWAPAWVSWRTSKDYVGWAPLPPEARFDRKSGIRNWADNHYDIGPDQYAFVPNNEFGSERIQRSVVPIERNIMIVVETTNVTNITYSNTMIVNQGPNFEEMRSRSRRPIERYRLERQLNAETAAPPSVRGEVLVMSAPALVTVPGVDRPQTVKETIAQTSVEKSWSADTDRPAADRARAKMKAESTPPPDAPSKTFVKPEPSGPSGAQTPASLPRISASPVTTPATAVPATPIPAPTVRATPAAITTPAPPMSASPTPAPTARATPKPASPIPAPTARTTPKPVSSPTAPPTAQASATAISTPTLPSPSVRPRQPAPPLKPSPLPIVSPAASPDPIAAPRTTPAVPTTPARVPQATPRRILPTPLNTPPARPSSTPPTEAVEKPAPRYNPASRPVASPRITPPASAPTEPLRPPVESKPIVPQTPSGIRLKPPAPAIATPPPNAAPSPAPENQKARKKGVRGNGQLEDTQPMPAPTSSAVPE